MKRLLIPALCLLPVFGNAEGSSFNSDFRMIDFDAPRDVCVAAGTQLFEDHESDAFGTLQDESDQKALGISLDQDWIAISIGENTYLVRPNNVQFQNC